MAQNTFLKQLTFVVAYVGIGVIFQIALFKTESNSWIDALFTKQWLWIIYFAISHFLVKRFIRRKNK
jgi:hypothetical protein